MGRPVSVVGAVWILDAPMLTGLILMPSSTWAVSGLSLTLCSSTPVSHSVLTNVVRPVPEAPGVGAGVSRLGPSSRAAWTDRRP